MFLSADAAYVSKLIDAGLANGEGRIYAYGRLALIAAKTSPVGVDADLKDLRTALNGGHIKHFAIANPDFAPYGRGARQVLVHAGLWNTVQSLLVIGENVAQTAQFALTSAAQGGLVSYSLALAPNVAARTKHALMPASWHKPVEHHMVLLKNSSKEAQAFYKFITSKPAQEILSRFGFSAAD